MKSTKFIIIISEIWNEEQLQASKTCLIKGLEQVNKKFPNDDLFTGIQECEISTNIKLDNCEIDVIINRNKDHIYNSINDGLKSDNLIVLFVGEVTVPFGQWILCDGIFNSVNIFSILNGRNQVDGNFVLVTPSPCEDWQIIEKKQLPYFSLCYYGLDKVDETDQFSTNVTNFINGIDGMLAVSPILHREVSHLSTLSIRNPSLYLFLDKGSASCPALLTLDGFSMLLNCGFNRNAESKRYLKYYQQIDVVLLSHIGYNNLLGLESYAASDSVGGQRINHLFVPEEGLAVIDKCAAQQQHDINPFHIDLRTKLTSMLGQLKSKGIQMSHFGVKAKSGVALAANNVKPIQLFHKIGYGSLEMIPLSPFEDDVDMKKFHDDWKKSKYSNDSLAKTLPSTGAVLFVWKPFNNKTPIKRIIYIGSKCCVKKYFPSLIATLHSTYDFLKQAEYTPADGLANKKPAAPRKPASTVSATGKGPSKSGDNVTTNAKKSTPPAEKPARPVTVAAQSNHIVKELPSKRPQTATNKTKSESSKLQETTKKPVVNTTKVAVTAPNSATKKPQPSSNKKIIDTKNQAKDLTHVKSLKVKEDKVGITNGAHHVNGHQHGSNGVDAKNVTDMDSFSNGTCDNTINDIEPDKSITDVNETIDPKPSTPDVSSVVAVGTVECAITEHGEADFCDDTPEEITADQMREMGLYDDEEEEKGRISSIPDTEGVNDQGIGNIAHLPMEGSFYGKETVEANNSPNNLEWNQPLAIPMPAKDATANNTKKTAGKSSLAIYVDCVCVPSDLDKEDLRYLFESVKSAMIYLQLEKPVDLSKAIEILLEEKEKDGANNTHDTKLVPSIIDESYLMWAAENTVRMESCRVNVAPDLTRCFINTLGSGDQANEADSCHGMKWEF